MFPYHPSDVAIVGTSENLEAAQQSAELPGVMFLFFRVVRSHV